MQVFLANTFTVGIKYYSMSVKLLFLDFFTDSIKEIGTKNMFLWQAISNEVLNNQYSIVSLCVGNTGSFFEPLLWLNHRS